MASTRDIFPPPSTREPNPLRPYYIPPSIGSEPAANHTAANHTAGPHPWPSVRPSPSTLGDLLPDLDLPDVRSTGSEAWTATRSLLDGLAWRYASVLMAQPFDVAKVLLQVMDAGQLQGDATPKKVRPRRSSGRRSARGRRSEEEMDERRRQRIFERGYGAMETPMEDEDGAAEDDASDTSAPDYFTSAAPRSRSTRKRRRTPPSLSSSPTPTPRNRESEQEDTYDLRLKRPNSVLETTSQLWRTSGAVGLWRATNATFVYSMLLRTTDSFLRGLILTMLGLSELASTEASGLLAVGGIDASESPAPWTCVAVSVVASALAGIFLAPLDMVRTRLLITPTSQPPRSVLANLRSLPSLAVPSSLLLPIGLLHAVPTAFSTSVPLLLRRSARISPEITPAIWSLSAFLSSLTELFIRLPLETVARRAQISHIIKLESDLPSVVPLAGYRGVMGSVYDIIYAEGETVTKVPAKKSHVVTERRRKGQGVAGLVRGWRVGFWGIVGVWGAGALGSGAGSAGGEF